MLVLSLACFFCAGPLASHGQQYIWSPDSILQQDPNFKMDRYHDVLRYHDPLMYLAFPVIRPVNGRPLALKNGEGANGYLLEGNFAYRFVMYKAKYYSWPLFQHLRITFDVDLMPRLTNDGSAPLLPLNNKVGLGLDYLLSPLARLNAEKTTLFWFTGQLHHYSNGQADSFFIPGPVQRNNYVSGDFSTNYYRGYLNMARVAQQKSIITTAVGYQRDIDLGGPLSRSPELYGSYGDQRLLFHFQITKKPRLVTMNYANRVTAENDSIQVDLRRQFTFRTQLEYILGDLSKFSNDNKRRLGWHTYFTYMPSVTNEVGLMLHTYLGRDYLNIRFDDYVFVGALGLYVKFNSR